MALEWLKTILGDKYTPEIDTAVSQEIGKGFVSRTDFNATSGKLKEAEAQVTQLTESVKTRDSQLEELKKSAGAGEELQKQIADLQKQNAEQEKAHQAELAQVKLNNAIDNALAAAGAKNNKAVRALLDLSGVKLEEDGKLAGFAEQLEALQKSDAYLFAEAQQSTFRGFQPGAGSGAPPNRSVDVSKMSYDELCAYMEQNPGAELK